MVGVRQKRPPEEAGEEIVEKGDIYFAYRPRIEEQEAEGLKDVQRFYMVSGSEVEKEFRERRMSPGSISSPTRSRPI